MGDLKSGRVIFFPMLFIPSQVEMTRLSNIQREIDGWRAALIVEWNKYNYNNAQRYTSKLRFHNLMRGQWKVIDGGMGSSQISQFG
jgi:hypothetical protein